MAKEDRAKKRALKASKAKSKYKASDSNVQEREQTVKVASEIKGYLPNMSRKEVFHHAAKSVEGETGISSDSNNVKVVNK